MDGERLICLLRCSSTAFLFVLALRFSDTIYAILETIGSRLPYLVCLASIHCTTGYQPENGNINEKNLNKMTMCTKGRELEGSYKAASQARKIISLRLERIEKLLSVKNLRKRQLKKTGQNKVWDITKGNTDLPIWRADLLRVP